MLRHNTNPLADNEESFEFTVGDFFYGQLRSIFRNFVGPAGFRSFRGGIPRVFKLRRGQVAAQIATLGSYTPRGASLHPALVESHLLAHAAASSSPPFPIYQEVPKQLHLGKRVRPADERHLGAVSASHWPGN